MLVTRDLVGDEPFAVILGDDVIDAKPPALKQMIDVFHDDGPVLAIEEVPHENVSSYGVIDGEEVRPGVYRIRDMVEKPPRKEAPSNLAIIGRYVLTPDIFPALEETGARTTGPARSSSPTGCGSCCGSGRSSAARSTVSGTTPATSSGS